MSILPSGFNVRVELNNNSKIDIYDSLHAAMAKEGFVRFVIASGIKYKLPKGGYWYTGTITTNAVYAKAQRAAASVWNDVDIVVTQNASTLFHLKKYHPSVSSYAALLKLGIPSAKPSPFTPAIRPLRKF